MEIALHIDALRTYGARLAGAAGAAGLDAEVPTCPRWRVRDLLGHIGGIHRWAAGNVTGGSVTRAQVTEMFTTPGDDELLAWFRAGHTALVDTLSAAAPDTRCFTFLPAPSPLAFWARRQAHETAIHRVDAELAAGEVTAFDSDFAIDGLGELLEGFMGRPGGPLKADPPVSLAVAATDADAAWTVHVDAAGPRSEPGCQPADATVRGTASNLYLLLWNRAGRDAVHIDGDEKVLDLWRDRATIRWS